MDLQSEKKSLLETFAAHFELHMHCSPLSSKILALLIIEGSHNGLTFEELVASTGASKSSVSTNLNLLLKSKKINFETFAGDRKKHFRVASFSDRMGNHLQWVVDEKKLVDRMVTFRTSTAETPVDLNHLKKIKIYQEHIFEVEEFLNKSIDKLHKLENR